MSDTGDFDRMLDNEKLVLTRSDGAQKTVSLREILMNTFVIPRHADGGEPPADEPSA